MVAVGERPVSLASRVMGTIESGRMLQVHLVKPGATKRLRTCSPSTLKIP